MLLVFCFPLSREDNVAFWNARKLEYKNTHFYVQLEKHLPIKAVLIDRLEVDTPEDLRYAQDYILLHKEEYDFWREDSGL